MQSEIVGLVFVAFFVLLILSIVFASKNKKLKNLAKQNHLDQKLLDKYYPNSFWFSTFLAAPIIGGGNLVADAYGRTGSYVFIGLSLLLIPVINKVRGALVRKAKQKEAEGFEGYKADLKLIRTHYGGTFLAWISFTALFGYLVGTYFIKISLYHFLTFVPIIFFGLIPLDFWVSRKLLEKAKLREGR